VLLRGVVKGSAILRMNPESFRDAEKHSHRKSVKRYKQGYDNHYTDRTDDKKHFKFCYFASLLQLDKDQNIFDLFQTLNIN